MSPKKQDASNKNLIESLAKISEAVVSDLYLDDVLKLIVTMTAEILGSKICSLMLLDLEKNELVIKSTQSMSEKYLNKPNLKVGEGIAGKVAETGEPISVYDLAKDKRFLNIGVAKQENLKSLISVPLILKGKVIGVLNCYTERLHKFTSSEISLVKAIANQSAIVIENFRLVVETNVIKEELEMRKIVERAKGILMKQYKIDEDEAYNRMRKYSMDKRKSMREVAEAFIMVEELRN
jgi:signal transduction protein with GAF and PtsI domain